MPSASIQQPARLRRWTNAGIGEVVGAGVAEPVDRELTRDELVAEGRERLHVQRDRVSPQVEELDAQLAIAALDLVDETFSRCARGTCGLDGSARRRSRTCTGSRGWFRRSRRGDRPAAARSPFRSSRSHAGNGSLQEAAERCRERGAGRRVAISPPRRGSAPLRARRATVSEASCRTPSSGSPTNMPSTTAAAARAMDSAGAVDACGPKQNIGAPNRCFLSLRDRGDIRVERRRRRREHDQRRREAVRRRAGRSPGRS